MPSKKTKTPAQAPETEQMIRQLYDGLMRQIEPELVTDQIQNLDFYYSGENDEERLQRMERYAKAMVVFEDRMNQLLSAWDAEIRTYREGLMARLRQKAATDESGALSSLDQEISNS